MGKLAAQKRHRHQATLYRDPQMEEYQVAAGLLRFVYRGCIVVYRGAHFVGGCGFDDAVQRKAGLVCDLVEFPCWPGSLRQKGCVFPLIR